MQGDLASPAQSAASDRLAATDVQRQQVRRAGELGGFPLTAQLGRTLNGTVITLELEGAPGAKS
jgi:hypothetical protein